MNPILHGRTPAAILSEVRRYEQAQQAYEAMKAASGNPAVNRGVEVQGYTRRHQTAAGAIVEQAVQKHSRGLPVRR